MKSIKTAALSGATFLAIASTAAYGQAARTWVSGVGDDVNPCSRTAPCKTFAGAISKTSAGGEINCLDPGGYGGVTITKSITIDCEDTQGSILASGINGVSVNDSASGFPNTINVVLRGISINGSGTGVQNASGNPGSGLVGVNFTSGASLVLEQVIIQDFNAGTATGVRIATGGSTRTYINNSTIINNGLGAAGGGIQVTPTGAGGTARVVVTNSRIEDNTNNGFRVDTTGNTNVGGVNVTIDNTSISGNVNGVVVNAPVGTTTINVMLQNAEVSNNTGTGLLASGATARIRVGNTAITGNATGVSAGGGGIINTYGTNRLNGNTVADGLFTAPPIGEQ
jgi:hypothetical protein